MTKQLTITRISSTDKKKDGSILEGKFGTYFRVGIQTEEYGDQWLNGFSNRVPEYAVGDVIEAVVTTEEWQGKEQLKFKLARQEDRDKAEIENLKKELADKSGVDEGDKKEEVVEEATDEPF